MSKVNLDALIPREDFEIEEVINAGTKKNTLSIEDLKSDSFFFLNLRKPDFQRETNEWDEKKICQLIKSFLDGELIPALILWRSTGGFVFVIDGAHRLSSLSAWINSDYGNGTLSKYFFDSQIPEEQIEIHNKTKKLIDSEIGSYEDFKMALQFPDRVKPEILQRAKNLASLAIQVQWVEGNALKAENSFFKINQQAAPIDKTELKLIENRRNANSIAARAVIRSGTGHKYWSKFSQDHQEQITNLAKEINSLLFYPKLETPIRTLDVPVAGKLSTSSTLPLILDIINITNKISKGLGEDKTGEETIQVLKRAQKFIRILNSDHPSSLGLHPIIYFYSKDGRLKVAMLYAMTYFIMLLNEKDKMKDFIKVRKSIEDIIFNYDYIIQQINRKYRSAINGAEHIARFLYQCQQFLNEGSNITETLKKIKVMDNYGYLTLNEMESTNATTSSDFNENRKSAVFIQESMRSLNLCKICGCPVHKNSISIDHIQKKSEGGLGTINNGQVTHPFCNTGFKS